MKRSLSHGAKKEYVKPEITRNEPLVDITFGTAAAVAVAGTLTGTGGTPGGFITKPNIAPGGATLGGGSGFGGGDDFGGAGSLTGGGSLLPGTGGAPGTVL